MNARNIRRTDSCPHRARLRRGVSLLELAIVTVIIGVLASMSVPSFQRGLEQSRVDLAAANLRSIWSAQRLYWLDYREYAPNLATLESLGLLDSAVAAEAHFDIEIAYSDSSAFSATATRESNARWNGSLSIDQTGLVSGILVGADLPNLAPGYQ
jgi:prepilin-type N-terminal cleavage/methylation domain-containing protein